jgi:formylglycine-generating enzyme required for sulfatase activity
MKNVSLEEVRTMNKKVILIVMVCLAMPSFVQAVSVNADWKLSGGTGSPTNFGCLYDAGGSSGTTGWFGDEIFTINEIGNGATSPKYYLDPCDINAQIEWLNAEMVVTVNATEIYSDYRSSYGAAVEVRNSTLKYLMGVRVNDNGDSTYTTTVDLIDCQTGSLTHPPLIGSYTLSDTAINSHRYNVEVTNVGTRAVTLYVDGNTTPVITGTAGTGLGTPPVELGIGDLRGSWGSSPTVYPNAEAYFDSVTFSTDTIMFKPEVTITEYFVEFPGNNGWAWNQVEYMSRPPEGPLTIYSIGEGAVSPRFDRSDAEEWLNAEMVVTVYESEDPNDWHSSYGTAVGVWNSTYKYLMGVRVQDLGGSVYQTTVDLINPMGDYPALISSYNLSDTGINQHQYNAEMDPITGTVNVYVDGNTPPVITAAAGIGGSPYIVFGDTRGGFPGWTGYPNADADWRRVTFSTETILFRPPPEPPTMQEVTGGGQGPGYTFYMSKYLITNEQLAEFLNDAEANSGNARGANVHINSSGNVYMNSTAAASGLYDDILYRRSGTDDLIYLSSEPAGSRYVVSSGQDEMPAYTVTWYGAMKYCNWLTIDEGLGEGERAYSEGPNPDDWRPVNLSLAQWQDGFDDTERTAWINYKGFRLPMDDQEQLWSPFNEWHKAASYTGSTNTIYGFGRNTMTGPDGNFYDSNDPWENNDPGSGYPSRTPVGFYDGSLQQKATWDWPDVNMTTYQTNANENAWEIYDLSGNIWKWTADMSPYAPNDVTTRGGSMISSTSSCSSALQNHTDPVSLNATGFHIVQVLDPTSSGEQYCGMLGTIYLDSDLSGPFDVPDCYVDEYDLRHFADQWLNPNDFGDFAAFAVQWLECTDPANEQCN